MSSLNRKDVETILRSKVNPAKVVSNIEMYDSRVLLPSVDTTSRRLLDKNPLRVYLSFFTTSSDQIYVFPQREQVALYGWLVQTPRDIPEFYVETHKRLVQEEWYGIINVGSATVYILELYLKGG